MAKKYLLVDGKKYKTSEYMGFQHSVGCYCWLVCDENGADKIAVRRRGQREWKFWTPENRLGRY